MFQQLTLMKGQYKNPFKTTEHELMNWCISYLSLRGHYVQRINSGRVFVNHARMRKDGSMSTWKSTINMAEKGTPDICGHTKTGKALYIEVKVKPNKPDPAQLEFIENAKRCGCVAGVIYTQEELEQFAEEQGL